jgi:hypothetical protein
VRALRAVHLRSTCPAQVALLRTLPLLRTLYLQRNGVADEDRYRYRVLYQLPTLLDMDGKQVRTPRLASPRPGDRRRLQLIGSCQNCCCYGRSTPGHLFPRRAWCLLRLRGSATAGTSHPPPSHREATECLLGPTDRCSCTSLVAVFIVHDWWMMDVCLLPQDLG